jgi:hypothetical protein
MSKVALTKSAALSTGQDEFVAPPYACRSGEPTLSVQRQAVEHLFETDFGARNVRSIPLPVARIL